MWMSSSRETKGSMQSYEIGCGWVHKSAKMASAERTISSSPVHCFELDDVILNTTSSGCRARWGLRVKYSLSLNNIGILQALSEEILGETGEE